MKFLLLSLAALHQLVAGSPSANTCTSPECRSFVASLRSNIDMTVEPCDDFYQYACGGWGRNNPIPDNREKWDISQIMHDSVSRKLIDMLSDNSDSPSISESYRKAKKVFHNCMDLGAIERNGVESILSRLRSTGGWPVMMGSNVGKQKRVAISRIHGFYTRELNLQSFYTLRVYPDSVRPSNKLLIEATSSTPFKDILVTHNRTALEVVDYANKIIEVVNILAAATGDIIHHADVRKDVDDLIDFEQALAKLITDPIVGEHKKWQKKSMTVKDLQTWYNTQSKTVNSRMRWISFLRNALANTGIVFTNASEVIFAEQNFATQLATLLDRTSKRTIVNYIQWTFVKEMLVAAPSALRNISIDLWRLRAGLKTPAPRNTTCTELMRLQHAVGYEFVKRHLSPNAKVKADEMITEIIDTTLHVIRQTSWLNAEQKYALRNTLDTMTRFIGYPEWYSNPANVDAYYEKCNISDNFLENIIEVRRFDTKMTLQRLAIPVDPTEFLINPIQFAATYVPPSNAITFTSAVLQTPLFSTDYPPVLQYAMFGAIVGHEISHAFDDIGFTLDRHDDVDEESKDIRNIYQSKVDCFIKQYNNYTVYEDERIKIKAKGNRTKDENISDLTGLKVAYAAYENIKTSRDENLHLPGLRPYNDKQLFFLAHASLWCSAATLGYYINTAGIDQHSISRLRSIGTLSNMKEFSEAFHCSDTAKMNPKDKCVLWGTDG